MGVADATGDAPFKYAVKEKLIVPSGPMLYYGRVLKRRAVDGALQYRVHFDGWHKRYDTWLSEEQCLADEPANVQLMEDFRKAQEAKEAARKPMPRGAAMREMLAAKKEEETRVRTADEARIRAAVTADEDTLLSGMEALVAEQGLPVGSVRRLCRAVADEWERVNVHVQLAPLPAPPGDSMLDAMRAFLLMPARRGTTVDPSTLQRRRFDMLSGIEALLARRLRSHLLYASELDAHDAAVAAAPTLSLTALYGVPLLMRVVVLLPAFLSIPDGVAAAADGVAAAADAPDPPSDAALSGSAFRQTYAELVYFLTKT